MAKQGDTMVLDVTGQLLAKNRQEVKLLVVDALERGERKFCIDLRRTGYIDSSGLGVLVSLSKRTREVGADLCLANLNSDLQHLFSTTRLDTLFRIENADDDDPSGPGAERPRRPKRPGGARMKTDVPPRGETSSG